MSLLSPETVRIALLPQQVAMLRFGRGPGSREIDRKCVACRDGDGRTNWSGSVDALRELLVHPNVRAGKATIVLSSRFVRYMVLPWSAELITQADELAFARARLVQIYGQSALDWAVVMSPAPAGAGRLCAAVDRDLIAAMESAMAGSPVRLVSLQPALMAIFNESRGRIDKHAWLVEVERGRLLIAWIRNRQWQSVRARPLDNSALDLAKALSRERFLLSADDRAPVFLANFGELAVATDGLRIESLAIRSGRNAGSSAEAAVSLALCGQ